MTATIIGGILSPYVRKVLAVCDLKGVAYQIDPIVPFFGGERFTAVSPLRRIPVFIDDQVTLSDSSVICQYLEDRYPAPSLYPADIADRARARWLEEFADTRMGDVFLWKLFNQRVIGPAIWKRDTDEAVVQAASSADLPAVMDYLDSVAPADGCVFGELSIADISVAVMFRNLRWARVEPEWGRWLLASAWIERVMALPALARVADAADTLIRTRLAEQPDVLRAAGFTLVEHSMAERTPRRGPMTAQ